MRVILGAALALAAAGVANAQENCEGAAASYAVRRADADTFAVEARFERPVERLDIYFFPLADRPEGQAESIRNLRAYGANGRTVGLNYVGEGAWETSPGAPATRIAYRVRADHDEVDWGAGAPGKDEVGGRFDRSYFFVGHAFFLVDFGAPECPIEVTFDLPRNWVVTSPWPMQGRVATAASASNLARNAFAIGMDQPSSANRGGMNVQWLIDSRIAPIESRVGDLMNQVPSAYTAFWGAAPVDRLTTIFVADTISDGGAFEDSFAMRIAAPLSAADEISWSHTLGHEMMHLWLGANAIRGVDPDELYWFTEGFTDYLTIKLMRRAGLIDEDRLAARIANVVRRFELARRFSPDVSFADAGRNKGENWSLIYGGGALAALLLDGELSAQSPTAFRDMMRSVLANADQPYTFARLMRTMDESSAGRASEIYQWLNARPSYQDIRARLAAVGIDSATFADEAYVAFEACHAESCAPDFLAGPDRD
ncbi:MAG: hypothetical protein R3C16_05110 [Hyphomonadaceae bacterium]